MRISDRTYPDIVDPSTASNCRPELRVMSSPNGEVIGLCGAETPFHGIVSSDSDHILRRDKKLAATMTNANVPGSGTYQTALIE